MQNGNCQQSLQRFYYSPRSGYCFLFKYTGCLGNENNFEYREECEEACRGVTGMNLNDCYWTLNNVRKNRFIIHN